MPVDQNVANHIWSQPQISVKDSILHALDVILLSLLFGLCIGIVYMALVACCPSTMVKFVFVGVAILALFAGIFILVKPIEFFYPKIWNILLGVALIITGLVFLLYLCCHSREVALSGIFMNHGNRFLRSDCLVWLYIPLFLLLTLGLIVLILWQYIAFGTAHPSTFNAGDLYRSSSHCIPLQILNAIELVWGLQFLRDACKWNAI
jgi:Ca2+/Na+ antiporter